MLAGHDQERADTLSVINSNDRPRITPPDARSTFIRKRAIRPLPSNPDGYNQKASVQTARTEASGSS